MPTVPPGIDGLPTTQVPEQWTKQWFMNLLRTWLRAADVRNATTGPGISITGRGIEVATITLTGLSITIVTAKLTSGGTQGSMTFVSGILTAQLQAT